MQFLMVLLLLWWICYKFPLCDRFNQSICWNDRSYLQQNDPAPNILKSLKILKMTKNAKNKKTAGAQHDFRNKIHLLQNYLQLAAQTNCYQILHQFFTLISFFQVWQYVIWQDSPVCPFHWEVVKWALGTKIWHLSFWSQD